MLTRIHYYSTGPAEKTFCLGMISWTCFKSELTCKATDTDKCLCVWKCGLVCKRVCVYVDKDKGCKQKSVFISQLNDTAIPQPGAHLKARSSSKLQHSSDHCLVVASQTCRLHLKKKKKILKDRSFPALLSSPSDRVITITFKGPICEQLQETVSGCWMSDSESVKGDIKATSSNYDHHLFIYLFFKIYQITTSLTPLWQSGVFG